MVAFIQILRNFAGMKMKKNEISVLIPNYNNVCVGLVTVLQRQAEALGIGDATPIDRSGRDSAAHEEDPCCDDNGPGGQDAAKTTAAIGRDLTGGN